VELMKDNSIVTYIMDPANRIKEGRIDPVIR
jgi:hypothetical protein